jgi:hypothetical protein
VAGKQCPTGGCPSQEGGIASSSRSEDIEAVVAQLRKGGARFRNDIVAGVGGKQILVEDPAGNPIELFEATIPEAKLSGSD